jgi:TP901 family phage tail tape measure protein
MASIKGLTIEIDGNTTKLSKALFQVNRDSRDLQKELKDIDKLLKFDPQNVELLNRKQEILNDTFKNTAGKLETLKIASEQAFKQLEKGEITKEQFRTLQTEISKAEQELKKLGETSKGISLEKIAEGFKDFGDKTTQLGKKIAPASIALAGVGTASVITGAKLEYSLAQIRATYGITDKSDEGFKKLTNTIKTYGKETKYSSEQVADAVNFLALAGYDIEKATKTLPAVLNLATAGNMDLARASDVLTDSLTALGLTNADEFVDKIVKTSQKANTSVEQLGQAILAEAGNFKILNGGLDETLTILGLISDNGTKSTEAATALRNIILGFAAPKDKADEYFQQLGVSIANAEGNMRPLVDILGELKSSLEGKGNVQKTNILKELFNKVDIKDFVALMDTTIEKYGELNVAIGNSEGTAKKVVEIFNDTNISRFEKLKSALSATFTNLYDVLEPTIKFVLTWLDNVLTSFNNLNPVFLNIIAAIGSVIVVAAPLLLVVGKVTAGVAGLIPFLIKMQGNFSLIFKVISGMLTPVLSALAPLFTLLISPIGLVVVAIGGLIAIFVTLYKKNEGFREAVNNVWNSIKDFFKIVLEKIIETVRAFIILFERLWEKYGEQIKKVFTNIWEAIKTIFNGAKEIVIGILQAFIGAFTGDWTKFTDGIAKIFKVLWEVLKGIVAGAWGLLKGAFSSLSKSISDWFMDLINSAKNWGKDLISGFVDGIKEMWSNIKDNVGNIASSIGNFFTGGGSRSFAPINVSSMRSNLTNENILAQLEATRPVIINQNIYTKNVNERLLEKEAMRNFNKIKGGFFL